MDTRPITIKAIEKMAAYLRAPRKSIKVSWKNCISILSPQEFEWNRSIIEHFIQIHLVGQQVKIRRVTTMAVNMLAIMPMDKVKAKPRIAPVPKL
jgi:hypothetical protein